MTRPPATSSWAASRPLARFAAVLAVIVLATLGSAGPAAAHNVLTSSNPTDGSVLNSAPQTVTLTFDQPVQNFEPVVVVTGPDGTEYQAGTPVIAGTTVDMALSPLAVAGAYTVAYRVVSTDGHPVQGQLAFELSAQAVATGASASPGPGSVSSGPAADPSAGSSSAAPSAASASAASPSVTPSAAVSPAGPTTSSAAVAPAADSEGLSGWIWAALAVAALLVITAVVLVVRRTRQA